MPRTHKVIAILVDGLSADYFEKHRAYMPHMSRLASTGTLVRRMRSTVPGTSVPGRSTMLTGVGAEVHGVYGNHILDGSIFRVPNPEDLRVPTIAGLARSSGLDVAGIGYYMVSPGDTSVFLSPWWERGFLMGSRFSKEVPTGRLQDARKLIDPANRIAGLPYMDSFLSSSPNDTPKMFVGLHADHLNLQAAIKLATSDSPPDLILTEIVMTDAIQHEFGFSTDAAHWSMIMADQLIGNLVNQLHQAGRADDYAIVIASDHGHNTIETAIFPESVIPEMLWITEGSMLYVVAGSNADRERAHSKLAPLGVIPWSSGHIPEEQRNRIATFVAPPMHSFEDWVGSREGPIPTKGTPHYVSSHGLRPGDCADDRVMIVGLPEGSAVVVEEAEANQFTPTLAALLGMPAQTYWPPPVAY